MRLLLAEDEKPLSRAVTAILEKNRYTVDAAYDGAEALDYIKSESYDGIILDIMMPKLDGFEVLKKIRKSGIITPVLFLTAKSEIEDKVEGLDLGANDYLTKPFDARELLARIRSMTRPAAAAGSSVLVCGNTELDRSTFILSGPKGECMLGNKEFQIMELMMSRPKQLMSSEQFIERAWGYDDAADVSVVWVNISNLRKKLAGVGSDIHIKASRNAGYSLEIIDAGGENG